MGTGGVEGFWRTGASEPPGASQGRARFRIYPQDFPRSPGSTGPWWTEVEGNLVFRWCSVERLVTGRAQVGAECQQRPVAASADRHPQPVNCAYHRGVLPVSVRVKNVSANLGSDLAQPAD